jgi:dipeptide/tripeptide permease
VFWLPIWHWFIAVTGTADESGKWYGFWSGFGGSNIVLLGGVFAYYRAHECHNAKCHWPSRHTTAKGYRLCRRCIAKPAEKLDLHEIHEDHQ